MSLNDLTIEEREEWAGRTRHNYTHWTEKNSGRWAKTRNPKDKWKHGLRTVNGKNKAYQSKITLPPEPWKCDNSAERG